jgi:hypothetical protein
MLGKAWNHRTERDASACERSIGTTSLLAYRATPAVALTDAPRFPLGVDMTRDSRRVTRAAQTVHCNHSSDADHSSARCTK